MNPEAQNWDSRHEAIVFRWSDTKSVLVGLAAKNSRRERHIVTSDASGLGRLDIDSLYVPGQGDALIVALHGALVRNDVDLPRFEWLGALGVRNEHQLYLADSVLSQSEKLTLGWFIGSESQDLTVLLAEYIEHIRDQLGLRYVVFVGSSGGGYASMAISTYISNSTVVCFTPQTNVWKFTDLHSQYLLSEAFPSFDAIEAANSTDPTRFSLIERYKTLPRLNKFLYIQNTGDREHTVTHFKPFAEAMGVRLPNGRSFDQSGRFISFNYGDGHVPPPKRQLGEFLDIALSDLKVPKKQPVVTAGYGGQLSSAPFRRGTNTLLRVPAELNSYYLAQSPPFQPDSLNVAYTQDGVPLRTIDGVNYDHPVLQAQYLLKQLNSLRLQRDERVEALGRATLRHWEEVGVESRSALFLPYRFEWHAGDLQPPWYSAMAQGQALSAVSRMYELFPESSIRQLAERLMASFELLPDRYSLDVPWVVDIDSDRYLWLEEYPYPGQGQCVLNGHLFAAWGLYDYWRVFDDARAKELANAAIETSKVYFHRGRNPGWSSHYDLNKQLLIRNYHQTHISQLEMTYNFTDNPYFLKMADILEADFPSYQRSGSLYLAEGKHILHRMDNTHVPTKSLEAREIILDKAEAVDFEVRTKAEEEVGVWVRLVGGEYDGWWVRESPPKAFPRHCVDKHYYHRRRRVVLTAGDYSHCLFNECGSRVSIQTTTLGEAKVVLVKCRALWNGVAFYQIDGTVTGSPIPDGRWISVDECN